MNTNFINELNLAALIKIRENSWNGKNYIELDRMITNDTDVINYRLDALTDLMESDGLFSAVKEIIPDLTALQETRTLSSAGNEELENFFAVRDLQIYVNMVDFLHEHLKNTEWKSELFSALKKGVEEITSDENYLRVKESIPENAALITSMKSVTIGVNLDKGLHPTEAGIVSVNDRRFVSGSIIDKVLRMDSSDNPYQCAAPLTAALTASSNSGEKQALEASLSSAIFKMIRSSIKSWKPAVKAYTSVKTSFILGYYNDLRFLTAAADFFRRLKEMNYPVCRPEVRPAEEKKCTLKGVYFPQLAIDGVPMVGNDFVCDENGMLYLFSGANSGGKTIFAKSVAVSQALFQMGLFVPAEAAELSPADEILLHFAASGRSAAQSRFTEECEKMSALMRSAGEYSLLICDEPFSGTSAFEASAIAEEVLKAMSAKGCRGIFITHIHELSDLTDKLNALDICRSKLDNLTVEVEQASGKRLFRVLRRKTAGSSYASDIADKYGLSFEQLMK